MSTKGPRYWDEITRTWRETRPQTLWRVHSDRVNGALFARWLPDVPVEWLLKTDLFDEAVSRGLHPLLASRARRVVGSDMSVFTLNAARSRHIDLLATGADARHLPFTDGAFDAVVSNSTLDHLETRNDIIVGLREFYRVLKHGGQLLLTLDNLANPLIALRNLLPFRCLNRLGLVPYYVGATVSPSGLRHLLARTGLEVDRIDTLMHCPRVSAVAMARLLERYATLGTQDRFLRVLMAFEHLSRWPTRYLTGRFVAARAVKN